jgi:uncharacterized protein YjiS (DUF1127 family)
MFMSQIVHAIRAYFQRQSEIRELCSMDSRQLADIGVAKGDLPRYGNLDAWFPLRSRSFE